jgi:tripartite-type tricarboxylate transporter receptor subunit TctC
MPAIQRRRFLTFAASAIAAPAFAQHARALDYPVRPVRVIVPFAPGGVTDTTARLIAAKLSEHIGKQFYVENIVGGSGNVGMAQAAKAAPDGYTVLTAFSSYVINPALFDHLSYDPIKDFDPVSLAVTSTTVLVVNPGLPVRNVSELIALIRANPGKYSYSSAGTGTTSHLAGEQLRIALGLDIVHVPFAGGAPAMAAVVGGHTPIGLSAPAPVVPLARDGKLRALAVTSPSRTQTLPDIPTMAEAGLPAIEGESFVGFVVPTGTPKEIVALLNREIAASLATADMRERQMMLGNDPVGSTVEAFSARIKAEVGIWAKVIRAANIKAG